MPETKVICLNHLSFPKHNDKLIWLPSLFSSVCYFPDYLSFTATNSSVLSLVTIDDKWKLIPQWWPNRNINNKLRNNRNNKKMKNKKSTQSKRNKCESGPMRWTEIAVGSSYSSNFLKESYKWPGLKKQKALFVGSDELDRIKGWWNRTISPGGVNTRC